jgi:Tfp pilus assembly protein PilF
MYGNAPLTKELEKCNEEFIRCATKEGASREAASQGVIKLAWQYFYKKDLKTAMRRFNQAWLLDPNNAEAFYGFGVLVSLQGKTDQAASFYKKALELNPNHPMALANLARSYKDKAYDLYRKKRLQYPDDEVKRIMGEALALYEKASQVATAGSDLRLTDLDSDLSYIYYQWAVALEFNGEYAKAWEKVKFSRKHGGTKIIEPDFIKELSKFMPEPKE